MSFLHIVLNVHIITIDYCKKLIYISCFENHVLTPTISDRICRYTAGVVISCDHHGMILLFIGATLIGSDDACTVVKLPDLVDTDKSDDGTIL